MKKRGVKNKLFLVVLFLLIFIILIYSVNAYSCTYSNGVQCVYKQLCAVPSYSPNPSSTYSTSSTDSSSGGSSSSSSGASSGSSSTSSGSSSGSSSGGTTSSNPSTGDSGSLITSCGPCKKCGASPGSCDVDSSLNGYRCHIENSIIGMCDNGTCSPIKDCYARYLDKLFPGSDYVDVYTPSDVHFAGGDDNSNTNSNDNIVADVLPLAGILTGNDVNDQQDNGGFSGTVGETVNIQITTFPYPNIPNSGYAGSITIYTSVSAGSNPLGIRVNYPQTTVIKYGENKPFIVSIICGKAGTGTLTVGAWVNSNSGSVSVQGFPKQISLTCNPKPFNPATDVPGAPEIILLPHKGGSPVPSACVSPSASPVPIISPSPQMSSYPGSSPSAQASPGKCNIKIIYITANWAKQATVQTDPTINDLKTKYGNDVVSPIDVTDKSVYSNMQQNYGTSSVPSVIVSDSQGGKTILSGVSDINNNLKKIVDDICNPKPSPSPGVSTSPQVSPSSVASASASANPNTSPPLILPPSGSSPTIITPPCPGDGTPEYKDRKKPEEKPRTISFTSLDPVTVTKDIDTTKDIPWYGDFKNPNNPQNPHIFPNVPMTKVTLSLDSNLVDYVQHSVVDPQTTKERFLQALQGPDASYQIEMEVVFAGLTGTESSLGGLYKKSVSKLTDGIPTDKFLQGYSDSITMFNKFNQGTVPGLSKDVSDYNRQNILPFTRDEANAGNNLIKSIIGNPSAIPRGTKILIRKSSCETFIEFNGKRHTVSDFTTKEFLGKFIRNTLFTKDPSNPRLKLPDGSITNPVSNAFDKLRANR